MKTFIFLVIFSMLLASSARSQVSDNILGVWNIVEMETDRFYKNYDTDSIKFASNEDQEKFKSEPFRREMLQIFEELGINSFEFSQDGFATIKFPRYPPFREPFSFDSRTSVISIGTGERLDTLKLTSKNLLIYDLSNSYEKHIITFRRKSK